MRKGKKLEGNGTLLRVHLHTVTFMFVFAEVVSWFAAAAVSSDVIMTEMWTRHIVLPTFIKIWEQRSKVSTQHQHSDLCGVLRKTKCFIKSEPYSFTLCCVKQFKACVSLRVGVIGLEGDGEAATRGWVEREIVSLQLLQFLSATQLSQLRVTLRNLRERNKKWVFPVLQKQTPQSCV